MDDNLLQSLGNDPDLRQACERALLLHHKTRTGPLPYETVLAIAAMLAAAMPTDKAAGELPEKPVAKPQLKGKRG